MSYYENQMWRQSQRTGGQTANQEIEEEIVANFADELGVSVQRVKNALSKAHKEAGVDPSANAVDDASEYTDGTIGGGI